MFCDHESQIKSTQDSSQVRCRVPELPELRDHNAVWNDQYPIIYGKILYEENFICLNTHLGKKNLYAEFHLVELNLGQLSS